jgi:WD40 repeat protein
MDMNLGRLIATAVALLVVLEIGCSKSSPPAGGGGTTVAADLQVFDSPVEFDPKFVRDPKSIMSKEQAIEVAALEFSHDGRRLLVQAKNATNGLQLWDISGVPTRVREWRSAGILSPDGKRVATATREFRGFEIVDVDTDKSIGATDVNGTKGCAFQSADRIVRVQASVGGSGPEKSVVQIIRATGGPPESEFTVREGTAFVFHSGLFNGGTEVAVGEVKNPTVDVWNVNTKARVRQVALAGVGPNSTLSRLIANSTGTLFASEPSGGVRFWDGTTGEEVAHVPYGLSIYAGAFIPGRDLYVSASNATRADTKGNPTEVVAYDVRDKRYTAAFRGGDPVPLIALAVSADGSRLAAGTKTGTVRVWDIRTLK